MCVFLQDFLSLHLAVPGMAASFGMASYFVNPYAAYAATNGSPVVSNRYSVGQKPNFFSVLGYFGATAVGAFGQVFSFVPLGNGAKFELSA